MDKIEIGKRIKARRIALGLTQKQIADGHITRNMLSLIESGSAFPSIETAQHIANKLNVPLSFLLSDTLDEPILKKNEAIKKIRELYSRGEYRNCINALNTLEDYDCETTYLLAYASFNYGKELTNNGSFNEAEVYLRQAIKKCDETIYDTSAIEATAPIYLAIVSNFQSPLLELDIESYENKHLAAYEFELYKYITSDFDFHFSYSLFRMHVEAKSLIKKYRFADAIDILKEIEEEKNTDYNSFVFFGVYTDLENCYKQLGDFENAYRYSSKRINLINAFSE